MAKIVDKPKSSLMYKLVNHHNIETFNFTVNSMLKEGWELYGSPTCTVQANGFSCHYQAMTLKVTEAFH